MYKDLAKEKMMKFFEGLEEICSLDTPPKGQGNTLLMILTPNKS
jgi:translation initiation factor IF-3